ncbi:MAG: helicase-associated domain-containing protein [Anaerolineae bacterium]
MEDMAKTLRDCLAEYPRIMLEAIAEGWGISFTDERTPEIVVRLATEMADAEALRIVLQRLSDVEREALAFVASTGQVKAHVMVRRYGPIRHLGPGRLEWEQAWQQPASATERLWFLGLIHRGYGMDEHYHGEVFFIPPEIQNVLPPLPVRLPVFAVEPASQPAVVRDDQDAFARDAFVILSYLRNYEVRTKMGVLAPRVLAQLRPRLIYPADQKRLQFLHHLCKQTGLIHREEELWKPTSIAASWLKEGAIARCRTFYHAWLEDANWNELWMMPRVHCEDTGWRNDPVLARKGMLNHLLKCPTDTWLTVASFVGSMHEMDPDFMRPDGDYNSWYIRDAQTGQYLMGYGAWEKVEGAWIRYLLEGPLLWLGVVATGYRQGEQQASCFMLTTYGAAILGLREIQEAPPQPIVVQPNFQVLVPHSASWYDRFLVERFAHWVDEQNGITRYAIQADSVRTCLASGVTWKQILAFLRRVTGNQVPNSVQRALQSWAKADRP